MKPLLTALLILMCMGTIAALATPAAPQATPPTSSGTLTSMATIGVVVENAVPATHLAPTATATILDKAIVGATQKAVQSEAAATASKGDTKYAQDVGWAGLVSTTISATTPATWTATSSSVGSTYRAIETTTSTVAPATAKVVVASTVPGVVDLAQKTTSGVEFVAQA